MAFALNHKQLAALRENMKINKLCGCASLEAAENHIPSDETEEFLRGMASGLLLVAAMYGDDDTEMKSTLTCFAAQAACCMQRV